MVYKARVNFPGIEQVVTLIIPYDYSVEGIAWGIATNNELLAFVDFIFDPSSAAPPRKSSTDEADLR